MNFTKYSFCIYLLLVGFITSAQKIDSLITSINGGEGVMVIPAGQPIPDSCQVIDKLNVRDNGYNNGCDYASILRFAKKITISAHGNILKINTVKPPDHFCNCYRIYGTVLYRKNLWRVYHDNFDDSVAKYKFGDTAKYAILYIYRPHQLGEWWVNPKLYLNDSTAFLINNGMANEIQLYKEGKLKISLKRKSEHMIIDVKYRHVYYLKCTIENELNVTQSFLEIMDKREGQKEYDKIKNDIKAKERQEAMDGKDN